MDYALDANYWSRLSGHLSPRRNKKLWAEKHVKRSPAIKAAEEERQHPLIGSY